MLRGAPDQLTKKYLDETIILSKSYTNLFSVCRLTYKKDGTTLVNLVFPRFDTFGVLVNG